MSIIDIGKLLQEVSPEAPSGPNLEYDPAYAELDRLSQGKPERQMGDNVIAAEATNWPDAKHGRGVQFSGPNPAAFIAWVGGFEDHKLTWGFGTDASWLWAEDARDGWEDPGFDTAGWARRTLARRLETVVPR